MNEVFIISAVRTPIGRYGGALRSLSATDLGGIALHGAIEKANISPQQVQEVIMGNVVSANLGQAPARQAAAYANIGMDVPCTLVNKVCSSGIKAVTISANSLALGHHEIITAGGMESMSNIPYYVPKARFGYKYGSGKLVDGLEKDGLINVFDETAMGVIGDRTAKKHNITREEQDEYAIKSYKRSASASESGYFKEEIIPVTITDRKRREKTIDTDEEFTAVDFDKIPGLRAAFTEDGSVTAANASTLNDGASALVLASEEAVNKYDLNPIAKILGYADAAIDPGWFTEAPALATPKALDRAGLNAGDIDYYEVNEAFSVVPLLYARQMDIDPERMNVHGGAVSLGHPLGASGARILTTLTKVLKHKNGKYGCAAICNGGGGATAVVIEYLS